MLEYMYNKKQRVLVVEDDSHLLTGIRDILEMEHYRVLTAKNGLDGLTVLQSDPDNPPDVIVSDIMMPAMNGFEFLEKVREQDKWVMVPFIFLTALGEKTDQNRGRKLGADVYLTKPFDAEDLIVAVDAVLKRKDNMERVTGEKMSDQKRKILTILNHEFRTPLTLVVAYAEMLKEFDPSNMSDIEVMSFLRGVNSGADRLRRLVENFISLVELDSGEARKTVDWRTRPVEDLGLLIEDALRQVELPDIRPRNWQRDIAPDLPTVMLDVQYMTIAIRELLDNAAKFSLDNKTITVSAHSVDNQIEIQVTDEGRGIPANEFDNIWQPFYQIDREKTEDQGAGSGLAIVDGFVKLHGGSRDVHSSVGRGSVFTIRIPINRATR
jgi:two-component system, sensor histidine kinase and response regulator